MVVIPKLGFFDFYKANEKRGGNEKSGRGGKSEKIYQTFFVENQILRRWCAIRIQKFPKLTELEPKNHRFLGIFEGRLVLKKML